MPSSHRKIAKWNHNIAHIHDTTTYIIRYDLKEGRMRVAAASMTHLSHPIQPQSSQTDFQQEQCSLMKKIHMTKMYLIRGYRRRDQMGARECLKAEYQIMTVRLNQVADGLSKAQIWRRSQSLLTS